MKKHLYSKRFLTFFTLLMLALTFATYNATAQQPDLQLPSEPLKFGVFVAQFDPAGTFTIQGDRWPKLNGSWKAVGSEIELTLAPAPPNCDGAGRYKVTREGTRVGFELVSDNCQVRRMIIDQSTWSPASEIKTIPVRSIAHTPGSKAPSNSNKKSKGSWPSFRGPEGSGISDGQNLPDRWDPKTGENILWRTAIPGLAHSSPVVWGNRVFVTSAVSSDAKATFRPGLYGDGDASKDRSVHRWMLYAIDKKNGKVVWEKLAHQGEPIEKRHIKATYANSSPATDGRIVVTWFGSHGVHAYDFNGRFLWKVDLGRLDLVLTTFQVTNGDQPVHRSSGTIS